MASSEWSKSSQNRTKDYKIPVWNVAEAAR
jgi:hypothetical protein